MDVVLSLSLSLSPSLSLSLFLSGLAAGQRARGEGAREEHSFGQMDIADGGVSLSAWAPGATLNPKALCRHKPKQLPSAHADASCGASARVARKQCAIEFYNCRPHGIGYVPPKRIERNKCDINF